MGDPSAVLVSVAAALGAIVVIWKALRAVYQWGREQARRLDAIGDIIQRELTPNGGESVKDSVTKAAKVAQQLETEDPIGSVSRRVDDLGVAVATTNAMLAEHIVEGEKVISKAIEQLGEHGINLNLQMPDKGVPPQP